MPDPIRVLMFDAIAHAVPNQTLQMHGLTLTVKRLDLVHPQISGNKFFKLKYNFKEAQRNGFNQILTFGGAYSNHIAATAYASHLHGFKSIGVIRGEELACRPLNSTLSTAQQFGMQLHFVSRELYRKKQSAGFLAQLKAEFPKSFIIPEGGTNRLAIQGCTEILSAADLENFDMICCAAGTGGTLAGLIEASAAHQHILGFSALKGDFLSQEIQQWTQRRNWRITDEFCHGGYAKTTAELMQFIQQFERLHGIPLEQVYTAKMFFGIKQMILRGEIAAHQRVLILHTGGLQGRIQA